MMRWGSSYTGSCLAYVVALLFFKSFLPPSLYRMYLQSCGVLLSLRSCRNWDQQHCFIHLVVVVQGMDYIMMLVDTNCGIVESGFTRWSGSSFYSTLSMYAHMYIFSHSPVLSLTNEPNKPTNQPVLFKTLYIQSFLHAYVYFLDQEEIHSSFTL